VIGKVTRGVDAGRLLYYLYGPGRANEHTDPHLVAGFGDPAELEPDRRVSGSHDLRRLSGLLAQPIAAMYGTGYEKPVWHCSIRAAPGDRLLSDGEWAQVAADVMDRTGLAGRDDELGGVRWVAVRHAADHIHIVATLARQDGGRPRVWNDFYRVREACRAAEERLGLQVTAPADRTAARRPSRAETEQAHRRGWDEEPRITLRREVCTAAAAAGTEHEFFERLREAGVLARLRVSTKNPGEITGYSVGLACHTNRDGGVVWYGGGKLAADLTLPKLRRRWSSRNATAARRITAEERNAAYEHAAREARGAAAHIRRCSASDPRRGADAAWAAADVLRIAARMLRDPALHRAADAYDRAARTPYGRIPRCTHAGGQLRLAARRLAAVGPAVGGGYTGDLAYGLAMLTTAVADLRTAQRYAAQAAAARRAAEHLRGVPANHRPGSRPAEARVRASDVARMDLPAGVTAARPPSTVAGPPLTAGQTPRRPSRLRPAARRARPPPS
jgi:hypothetical protein